MRKVIAIPFLAFALAFAVAPHADALSCVPLDMYLEKVISDEADGTFVVVGTATKVTADHTQVVTVKESYKGHVAKELWVEHPYNDVWQYFCSNGPAEAGEETVFFITIDEHGTFTAVQTLDASSKEAKDFIAKIEKKNFDAGITQASPEDREAEVFSSIQTLVDAITALLKEFRYWQSR